jgi:iron(III) transport system ATP-binding protein
VSSAIEAGVMDLPEGSMCSSCSRPVLRTTGVTAVLVTHDRSEALSLGDQVAVMRDGRIIQASTPDELYTAPADAETAAFVSDATMLDAHVDGGYASTALGRVPIDPRSPVTHGRGQAVIRPEQFRVAVEETCSAVEGIVTKVEYFGHDARVEIAVRGDDGDIRVAARMAGSALPSEGSTVHLAVESALWIVAPMR